MPYWACYLQAKTGTEKVSEDEPFRKCSEICVSNPFATAIEANVRALLLGAQGAPGTESGRPLNDEELATMVRSFQAEGVSFTVREGADEGASIPPGQVRKEAAWRAVEDLPDIPKLFYQLAGERVFPVPLKFDSLTPASDVLGAVFGLDGQGGRYV